MSNLLPAGTRPLARSARLALLVSLAIASLAVATTVTADAPSHVVVQIRGLRSDRGEVRGGLFPTRDGWTEAGHEIARCHVRADDGVTLCDLGPQRPGTYAFAFMHDEDGDGELDRDWIGLPAEGFGFSNDAPTGLGPPSFESAAFQHDDADSTTIRVRARYGL